jgi:hypothetical protein
MAALSSTVHVSVAKALRPTAGKRAVAVKAAARADSNNEVRAPGVRFWLPIIQLACRDARTR